MFFNDHLEKLMSNIKNYYEDSVSLEQYKCFEKTLRSIVADCEKITQEAFSLHLEEHYLRVTLLPTSDYFQLDSGVQLNAQIYFRSLVQKSELSCVKFNKRNNFFMQNGKTGMYQEQIKDLVIAKREGFDEVIYCDDAGVLLEATTSNLVIVDHVKRSFWYPENNKLIYSGLIIKKVRMILEGLGFEFEDSPVLMNELNSQMSVFLTNSVSLVRGALFSKDSVADKNMLEILNKEIFNLIVKEQE